MNGIFLESELLSNRFQYDFGVKSNEFIPALKEIMSQVRKPGAPSCFALFKPYLKRWKVNLNKTSFFKYWFSGEHPVTELIAYAYNLKKRGIKVFILSNNFKERTEYYRKSFPDIFSSVDQAYFSWETGFVKPDQNAFLFILQVNQLKSEECVYFDNDEKNVAAAQSIGLQAFHYSGFIEMNIILEKAIKN